jgi:predicted metal-dependent phosphoesterase TrpH
MQPDPVFAAPGRFLKGNIHTHSTLSDGKRAPEDVVETYRRGGYDFMALTDHFMARYGFPIADTRRFRAPGFTTLLGAEVHAPARNDPRS